MPACACLPHLLAVGDESGKLWIAAPHLRMCDRQAVDLHKGTFVKAAGCFSSYFCL